MPETKPVYSVGQTLNDLLEWTASRFADNPALLYTSGSGTETWTYSLLEQQAGRVAAYLRACGVSRGDRVVIWAPSSPWWVASFFGIMRIGAIVVPLDVRSSPDFVRRVISQSEPHRIIAASQFVAHWQHDVPIVDVAELDTLTPHDPDGANKEIGADDLAEIIFTSGTTGTPKGVMLSHGNIRSTVEAMNLVVPSGPKLRPLSILPLSHLLEQTVGLMLSMRGGTRIAISTGLQPALVQRDMRQHHVTTMVLVPRILSLFMDSIEQEVRRRKRERQWLLLMRISGYLPRKLRRLLFRDVIRNFGGQLDFFVSGGATLDPDLERKWELLGVAILQGYGASETSPVITSTSIADRKPRSVGKPMPGVQIRIARDEEILVKGPNVMQGYWKNPQATAAVIVDGWYLTGDLGEMDADGRLYLKGRKRDLIVLSDGLNVYPEDVENALRRAPGLVDCVVMGIPSSRGPEIHAVMILQPGIDPADCLRQANAMLGSHQRIRSFTLWPESDFPRTHTAKIKRHEVIETVLAGRREHQENELVAPPPGS